MYNDVKKPFIAIAVITLLLSIVVAVRAPQRPVSATAPAPELTTVRVGSPGELEQLFTEHDYRWPPAEVVPPLALESMPAGMDDLAVDRKKALFFRAVLPLILAENSRIRQQRGFVQQALDGYDSLDRQQRRRLRNIAEEYEVDGDLSDPAVQNRLRRRVDIIPVPLALAQAANESAWGAARFTRRGNSLFGVWTWNKDKGMVPRRREEGKKHLVRAYPDLGASVRAYMHTLNTVHAYRVFREVRRDMRLHGKPLDAVALAGLLDRYSERGTAYVAELRQIILGNSLNRLDRPRLEG